MFSTNVVNFLLFSLSHTLCFFFCRLYSSAVFNDSFSLYTTPEIQRKPVDDLVLQMKAMNIHKVLNFPFPSAPDLMQIKVAELRLRLLGALSQSADGNQGMQYL